MMDWGLTTVILAVAFLVGHLFMDFRSLAVRLQRPHIIGEDFNFHSPAPVECERCHARWRGKGELRHEVAWTIAAIVVLTGHLILDFIQRGG